MISQKFVYRQVLRKRQAQGGLPFFYMPVETDNFDWAGGI